MPARSKCNCNVIVSSALDLDERCAVDKYLAVRGLSSVVWCGNFVNFSGNYSKKCGFSIALNKLFPGGRFSVDASGKKKKWNDASKEKRLMKQTLSAEAASNSPTGTSEVELFFHEGAVSSLVKKTITLIGLGDKVCFNVFVTSTR